MENGITFSMHDSFVTASEPLRDEPRTIQRSSRINLPITKSIDRFIDREIYIPRMVS